MYQQNKIWLEWPSYLPVLRFIERCTILTLQWTPGFTVDWFLSEDARHLPSNVWLRLQLQLGRVKVVSPAMRLKILLSDNTLTLNTTNIKFYWQPRQHWYPSQQLEYNPRCIPSAKKYIVTICFVLISHEFRNLFFHSSNSAFSFSSLGLSSSSCL